MKAEKRKYAEPSRDRSGNTFVRNEQKIATHSTKQMPTIAKMILLLKNEIGNFIFCKKNLDK